MRYQTRCLTVDAHTLEPGETITTAAGSQTVAPGDVLVLDGGPPRLLRGADFAYLFEPAPECEPADDPEPEPTTRRRRRAQ